MWAFGVMGLRASARGVLGAEDVGLWGFRALGFEVLGFQSLGFGVRGFMVWGSVGLELRVLGFGVLGCSACGVRLWALKRLRVFVFRCLGFVGSQVSGC